VINHIAVTNWSSAPDRDVQFAVESIRAELPGFCAAWGVPIPGVQFYSREVELPAREAMIVSGVDTTGSHGTLGEHTIAAGLPFFIWDVAVGAWVFHHELYETLADPMLDQWAFDSTGRGWPVEVCDATQADTYLRDVTFFGETRGMAMANWLRPEFFGMPSHDGKSGCDAMGVCQPFTVRPGGYAETMLDGRQERVGGARSKGCSTRVLPGDVKLSRSALRRMRPFGVVLP
jgi:hypothetical protein